MWKNIKKKLLNKTDIDYLIVGLGNPGEKYLKTAHNAGFRVVSIFRENENLPNFTKDNLLNAHTSKGEIDGKNIVLLLPLTFMNKSGDSVQKALRRFDLPLENILVIHDDTDLEAGVVRFSLSSGSAGHKGVSSIIRMIKTKDFFRLRIGVRQTENQKDALSFVLQKTPNATIEIEKEAALIVKEALVSGLEKKTVQIKKAP